MEGAFNRVTEDTSQGNLMTEQYAQIVGLS